MIDTTVRELLEQMPGFQAWNAMFPEESDWYHYEYHRSRIGQAIYLSDLFWPTFIEREGLILRVKTDPSRDLEESIQRFREVGPTPQQIEYVLNHVHIADCFLGDAERDKVQPGAYHYLAHVLIETWRCRLHTLFPSREFVVATQGDDRPAEIYAYTVRET